MTAHSIISYMAQLCASFTLTSAALKKYTLRFIQYETFVSVIQAQRFVDALPHQVDSILVIALKLRTEEKKGKEEETKGDRVNVCKLTKSVCKAMDRMFYSVFLTFVKHALWGCQGFVNC